MSESNLGDFTGDSNIQNNEVVDTTKTTESTNNQDSTVLEVSIHESASKTENDDNNTANTSTENTSTTTTSTPKSNNESEQSTSNDSSESSTLEQPSTPLASHAPSTPITAEYTSTSTTKVRISSVRDIGISCEKNPRFRRTMEDEHVIIDCFGGDAEQGYFAIYDGHGGRGAVEFTAKTLHNNLLEELNKSPNGDIPEHIRNSYLSTDRQMEKENIQFSGTTVISALIRKNSENDKYLYIANAGDARAVICQNKVAERLSYDHKGSDQEETKRITEAGGFVVNNRVIGLLAVTRSLGDHSMKDYVIGDPYQRQVKLDETHSHLILACDGLWDVISDQEAVDLILPETEAQKMSDKLLSHALRKGSTDNISIMVIIL
eukprot:gene9922-12167_t